MLPFVSCVFHSSLCSHGCIEAHRNDWVETGVLRQERKDSGFNLTQLYCLNVIERFRSTSPLQKLSFRLNATVVLWFCWGSQCCCLCLECFQPLSAVKWHKHKHRWRPQSMYYWLFWVIYLLRGEHLSTGKYTFLRLDPFISLSLLTETKSLNYRFKTPLFNVSLFLNVFYFF